MNEEKIINLWRWFYSNNTRIINCIESNLKNEQEFIVNQLDNLILDFGRLSWDVEKGNKKSWSFTISPNGEPELLKITKEIITNAPELENWEFNYAKQAKKWDRKLSIYDFEMELHQIDITNWEFLVTNNSNGMFDLLIEAPNTKHLDKETCNSVANIAVINEIGEEAKILKFASISIVNEIDEEYEAVKENINSLRMKYSD